LANISLSDITRDGAAIALANVRHEDADVSSHASCIELDDDFGHQ
jgi:hypothetical protein